MKPIDFYNEDSNNKERISLIVDREQKSLKIIKDYSLEHETEKLTILDIGCGDGMFLTYLERELRRKCTLYGIDY